MFLPRGHAWYRSLKALVAPPPRRPDTRKPIAWLRLEQLEARWVLSASISIGDKLQFKIAGDEAVTWAVTGTSGASIDANGLFTAGDTVGVATVTARSVAQPARSIQDTVTIGISGTYRSYDSSGNVSSVVMVGFNSGQVTVSLALGDAVRPDDVWEGTVSGNTFDGSEAVFLQYHFEVPPGSYIDPEQTGGDQTDTLSATVVGGNFTGTAMGGRWANFRSGFTFKADRNLQTGTETLTLPPGPKANNDAYDDPRNTTLRVPASKGVLVNDTYGTDRPKVVLEGNVTHGTLGLNDDGSFVYTPDADYKGKDSFTYHDEDKMGNKSNSATVTLTVGLPPKAADDSYQTKRGASLVVHADTGVLANDTDAEKDPLTAVIEALPDPNSGTLSLADDGSFEFDPSGNFTGDVTFKYRAKDQDGLSDPATVTITVGIKPTAIDHQYTIEANTTLQTDDGNGVLAGAAEDGGENDPITAKLKDGPSHGRLVRPDLPDGLNDDGSFTYVPNANYRGPDTFTYLAHDQDGDSKPATVTIQVGKVPAVKDHSYVVPRASDGVSLDPLVADSSDLPYQRLLADATPGESGTLTAFLETDPTMGGISAQHGAVVLSPDGGSFTYTVTDPTFHG